MNRSDILKIAVWGALLSSGYLAPSGALSPFKLPKDISVIDNDMRGDLISMVWKNDENIVVSHSGHRLDGLNRNRIEEYSAYTGEKTDGTYVETFTPSIAVNKDNGISWSSKPLACCSHERITAQIGSEKNTIRFCYGRGESYTPIECNLKFEAGLLRFHPSEVLLLATCVDIPSKFAFIVPNLNSHSGYEVKLFGLENITDISDVSWSPDGSHIAFIGTNGLVEIFNAHTKRIVADFQSPFADDIPSLVTWVPYNAAHALSKHKHMILTSGPKGFYVWDAFSGKMLSYYEGILKGRTYRNIDGKVTVREMAFSPNGSRLALGLLRSVHIVDFNDFIVGSMKKPVTPFLRKREENFRMPKLLTVKGSSNTGVIYPTQNNRYRENEHSSALSVEIDAEGNKNVKQQGPAKRVVRKLF